MACRPTVRRMRRHGGERQRPRGSAARSVLTCMIRGARGPRPRPQPGTRTTWWGPRPSLAPQQLAWTRGSSQFGPDSSERPAFIASTWGCYLALGDATTQFTSRLLPYKDAPTRGRTQDIATTTISSCHNISPSLILLTHDILGLRTSWRDNII